MSNWKTYGAGVVIAGVTLTGVLWFDRPSPYIAAEDLAELVAAVNERALYAFAVGTNRLEYASTNQVAAFMTFSQLYGEAMCPARAFVTNHFDDAGIKIFWTPNGFLEDGEVVAEAEMQWYLSGSVIFSYGNTLNYYATTPPSNAVSSVETTDTYKYTPSTRWWPTTIGTNIPVPGIYYPHVRKDVELYGGTNNWWTANGFGTNVWKYDCERWLNIGNEELAITKRGGTGFMLSTNELTFPLGDVSTRSVSAHSTGSDTNVLLASLYEVTGWGRDKATFVVSDAGSDLSLNLELSARTLTIDEGSSDGLLVRPLSPPSGPFAICNVASAGDGITVDKSALVFTQANWSNAQSVAVSASENDSRGDTAALVMLTYATKTCYIAVSVADNDGISDDIRVSPVLSTVTKGGSAAFSVLLGTVSTNAHIDTDTFITTNNLNQAHSVLKRLNRTIAFVSPGLAQGEGLRVSYSGYTNESSHSDLGSVSVETMWTLLPSISSVSTSEVALSDAVVAYGWINAKKNTTEPKTVYSMRSYSDSNFDAYVCWFTNCFLPYPHRQAFESNYVSRVAIYAVAYADYPYNLQIHTDDGVPSPSENVTVTHTFSGSSSASLDANTLGIFSFLSEHPSSIWNGFPGQIVLESVDSIMKYRVALLADVENPTDVPVFNIGTPALPVIDIDSSVRGTGNVTYDFLISDDESVRMVCHSYSSMFYTKIRILGFVVMVDWNWKHLNPSAPFVPVPHTPEWIISNTNVLKYSSIATNSP